MSWQGSATPTDRLWSCLPYLLPLIEGVKFGTFLFKQFPVLENLLIPLVPLLRIYSSFRFTGVIIFFGLLFLVVRNTEISRFIRFNTMQAILLDIVVVLCGVILSILGPALGGGLVVETLVNVVFLGTVAAVFYSLFRTVQGEYAEIPTISDAVNMQVR